MEIRYSIREPMAPGTTLLEKFRALSEIGIAGIEIPASSSRVDEYPNLERHRRGVAGGVINPRGEFCLEFIELSSGGALYASRKSVP